MEQKITKDNLTSEKQDCSTRNPLPRDTTMAQKSHGKIKISKIGFLRRWELHFRFAAPAKPIKNQLDKTRQDETE